MSVSLLSLCLLSFCGFRSGACPDPLLTAPIVRVRAGDDVTLRCPLVDEPRSTGSPLRPAPARVLAWYRQTQGGPEVMVSLDLDRGVRPGHGPGQESGLGFSLAAGLGSKVSVGSDGSLVLKESELGDSGLYFCSISDMRENMKLGRYEETEGQ